MHRQFFGKLSQNREYVKSHFNDLKNSIHFAIRELMIKQ